MGLDEMKMRNCVCPVGHHKCSFDEVPMKKLGTSKNKKEWDITCPSAFTSKRKQFLIYVTVVEKRQVNRSTPKPKYFKKENQISGFLLAEYRFIL